MGNLAALRTSDCSLAVLAAESELRHSTTPVLESTTLSKYFIGRLPTSDTPRVMTVLESLSPSIMPGSNRTPSASARFLSM